MELATPCTCRVILLLRPLQRKLFSLRTEENYIWVNFWNIQVSSSSSSTFKLKTPISSMLIDRVRHLPWYEVFPHIPEHCPSFRLQAKLHFPHSSQELPTPTLLPSHLHISIYEYELLSSLHVLCKDNNNTLEPHYNTVFGVYVISVITE